MEAKLLVLGFLLLLAPSRQESRPNPGEQEVEPNVNLGKLLNERIHALRKDGSSRSFPLYSDPTSHSDNEEV